MKPTIFYLAIFCLLCSYNFKQLPATLTTIDPVAMVQQQVWQNLTKVPGTQQDYITTVHLRIADGHILDADCRILFPASSWAIASILLDDYKAVLQKSSVKIFEVFYRLISDPTTLASEININGLWRPWPGHVHKDGRGMDFASIRSSNGDGVIFDFSITKEETSYGKSVRTSLSSLASLNQYLSPWFMCSPLNKCLVNEAKTPLEKQHRNHLHVTLNP